ncbi:MAG: nucleotidyltransferase domain-containing protein [Candidatus Rokubacteria bacterium]|nr:nucleotidyltransferase domain-containing protein [Candidatus Rokubacteria bacterium]
MTRGEISEAWKALANRAVAEYREALGEDLLALACFGSVARGAPGPDSDLDLYVVTRSRVSSLIDPRLEPLTRFRETPEYQRLAREGHRPDPMPVFHSVAELAKHPWILLDIADHGVILYDPEGVLNRELEKVRCRLRELGSKRIERPDGSWYWDLKPDWRPGELVEL